MHNTNRDRLGLEERLFKEAGVFLTREELEKLLMLRRQTDLLLLDQFGK